ncbi:expressed unknown protein [Seminavis robusta]|uniref:Uncharacterized protein n=1 Tax=Seminavis robusta TaxID=568900 RepID=A0A9N8HBL8_9STRA|nr:expressed unknown protein [Seminavis robusta]|eukprot:Sro368_g128030.1 n/a (512) ;mRNA; r:50220-51755
MFSAVFKKPDELSDSLDDGNMALWPLFKITLLVLLLLAAENDGSGTADWVPLVNGSQYLHGEKPHDLFGWSIALSSDASTVAIGAIDSDNNGSASGQVRVYQLSDNGPHGSIIHVGTIEGDREGDYSGYSVSLDHRGNILAIGAPEHQQGIGKVSIFRRVGKEWVQMGNCIEPTSAGAAGFGHTLVLSQDGYTIVVGAPYQDGNRGSVWTFTYNSTLDKWESDGEPLLGDESASSQFGYSVAISANANVLAVGAKNHPGPQSSSMDGQQASRLKHSKGQVQVFLRDENGNWVLHAPPLYGAKQGDYFGFALAFSHPGNRLAIGSPYTDTSAGRGAGIVKVIQLVPQAEENENGDQDNNHCSATRLTLVPVGLEIAGARAGDYFGYSVSLAATGRRLAVGARQAGELRGQVTVYDLEEDKVQPTSEQTHTAAWRECATPINGDAASDQSGFAVALSAEGTHLAIGAPYHDGVPKKTEQSLATGRTFNRLINSGQTKIFHFAEKPGPREKTAA